MSAPRLGQSLPGFRESYATNERGNQVYKGVVRRTDPSGTDFTIVAELTRSQDQAKQLYDKAVADIENQGFVARPDLVPSWGGTKYYAGPGTGLRIGSNADQQYYVMYHYNSDINSWEFTTKAL